jgi:hypothetical protein
MRGGVTAAGSVGSLDQALDFATIETVDATPAERLTELAGLQPCNL